jgi:hypothetical protein
MVTAGVDVFHFELMSRSLRRTNIPSFKTSRLEEIRNRSVSFGVTPSKAVSLAWKNVNQQN